VLKRDVPSLYIALLSQTLLEGVKPHARRGVLKGAAKPEHTDPPDLPRLLRLRDEGRKNNTESENDREELAAWVEHQAIR
jgi:hypothetical protein